MSELPTALAAHLATALAAQEGAAEVVAAAALAGGCIHRAARVDLAGGRRLFVKWNDSMPEEVFAREAEGLAALAAPGILRTPAVLGRGRAGTTSYLALELIEEGSRGGGFAAALGRDLARHHRAATGPRWGFDRDNHLGATPQPNGWEDDWCTFWRRHRLGWQLDLARANGLADRELEELAERLLGRLDEWLGDLPGEPPCLLHGDLWAGNVLADASGRPVLIDPAAYYGQREADLAMARLFGGFGDAFWRAYEEEWPLPAGSEERLVIYELYHLLNHLNLFGSSYRSRCVAALRQLVG